MRYMKRFTQYTYHHHHHQKLKISIQSAQTLPCSCEWGKLGYVSGERKQRFLVQGCPLLFMGMKLHSTVNKAQKGGRDGAWTSLNQSKREFSIILIMSAAIIYPKLPGLTNDCTQKYSISLGSKISLIAINVYDCNTSMLNTLPSEYLLFSVLILEYSSRALNSIFSLFFSHFGIFIP